MPNALAHLGAQGFLTRAVIREADIKWIFLGALSAFGILIAYFVLPITVMSGIVKADAHFIGVIKSPCTGCFVAFDRAKYIKNDNQDRLKTWNGEYIIANRILGHSATVSIKAIFDDDRKIHIKELYEHRGFNRDIPTFIGLGIVALTRFRSLSFSRRKKA